LRNWDDEGENIHRTPVRGGRFSDMPGSGIGSLLLGLYDDAGLLHHVRFLALQDGDQPALTKKKGLQRCENRRDLPDLRREEPSRWSTEHQQWGTSRSKMVVERVT